MARRPRIVHVVRQFWPLAGGMEESVRQLARSTPADFEVGVVTLDRAFADGTHFAARDSVDGIAVTRIPYTGSHRYPLAPRVFAATASADLIHVHGIDFLFDALALGRSVRAIPLVASTHGGFFHTPFASRLKRAFFATVTRASARAYATIGASSVGDAELFGTIADNVELLENGVDIAKFAAASSTAAPRVLIAIGRWSSNKNLRGALDLLTALRRTDLEWRLLIAGNPYDCTRDDLDGWIEESGAGQGVEIHEGLSTPELRALIARATYLLSLSHYEGFGLSVVEGLSAGLVPVLSGIANYRLFVERAGVGIILDQPSPAAKAAALIALHGSAADREPVRNAAMAAAQRYAWPDVARRWAAIYDRALRR